MKVVINKCHGGFSLSHEGVLRYAEIKGITLYPEPHAKFKKFWTYWTVPEDQRQGILSDEEFRSAPMEARIESNRLYSLLTIDNRSMPRNDPALVQLVEEMGAAADGDYAELGIVEIPDSVDWEVEEYDGKEWVVEKHRKWY